MLTPSPPPHTHTGQEWDSAHKTEEMTDGNVADKQTQPQPVTVPLKHFPLCTATDACESVA